MLHKVKRSFDATLYRVFDRFAWRSFMHPRPLDYGRVAYAVAAKEAADFMVERMQKAANKTTKQALLQFAINEAKLPGLWLEFGVFQGADIRTIATKAPKVYGFDSFEGLPEDWTYFQPKGHFSLNGRLPEVPRNVELIKGWFNETLPGFLSAHPEPVSFLHIDSDLYSSAKTVLELLAPRIVPGTIILFDDFLNYPGWRDGEAKAFFEFMESTGRKCRYLAFASAHSSVCAEVIG